MRELKPCPFCGGKVHLETDLAQTKDPVFCFICDNCGAIIYMDDLIDENESIEAWNTRANPWCTGEPTEEGWYLIAFLGANKRIEYASAVWCYNEWDAHCRILAWQRIEPYKEASPKLEHVKALPNEWYDPSEDGLYEKEASE